MKRRTFLNQSGQYILGAGLLGSLASCSDLMSEKDALALSAAPVPEGSFPFKISLAQWSLHKSLWAGEMDHLDFAATAMNQFGIQAIEYVDQFFSDKAEDTAYLNQMNQRAADHGVKQLLIMVDTAGPLATLNEEKRKTAIENHFKWINAAKYLGCHSIRVNAAGKGEREEVKRAAIDSLRILSQYAIKEGINVLVENHGGYSSDPRWLVEVMHGVALPNCGTLPDFGNFLISFWPYQKADPYEGMKKLMGFARGVSAKSHEFNSSGQNKKVDFFKMMKIVQDADYRGYVGIEYEGYKLSEKAGILATKQLILNASKG